MSLDGALIAFDLDGTLVDTAPDLIGSLNVVLAEQDLGPVPVEAARVLVGRGTRNLIERGFAHAGRPLGPEEVTPLLDRFMAVYIGRIAAESAPFHGVDATLDELSRAGARLAVCTNKNTHLSIALLEALGLADRFDAVVGADITGAQKPDPRPLLFTIERVGGSLQRTLYVGDSMIDQKTARAAGVPVVGVSFGYNEVPLEAADFDGFIDRYEDLPALAAKLLEG